MADQCVDKLIGSQCGSLMCGKTNWLNVPTMDCYHTGDIKPIIINNLNEINALIVLNFNL